MENKSNIYKSKPEFVKEGFDPSSVQVLKDIQDQNTIDTNGYEYIDLGLPSGTLWATMNVGATSETDTGLYFAWGETTGYTADQVGVDKNFSWSDYELTNDGGSTFTKYNSTDGLTNLELTDDAAHVNMGGEWHMPTKEQCNELLNCCTIEQVTNYNDSGIDGCFFISNINGKRLFIPFTGDVYNGEKVNNNNSYMWTNSFGSSNVYGCCRLFFYSDGGSVSENVRYNGNTIRGVI